MKLTISYAELQEYVASHFHKTVNVGHVDGKTVSVSLPIKVFGFTKSVSINVGVEKIEGTDLYLSYDGKMGIDLLVSPAISYAGENGAFPPTRDGCIHSLSMRERG